MRLLREPFAGRRLRNLAWLLLWPLRAALRYVPRRPVGWASRMLLEPLLPNDTFEVVLPGGDSVTLGYRESLGRAVLLHGGFEDAELAFVLDYLAPGDVAVDVCAYVGWFTLPIARRVGPSGLVIAIEPLPTSLARLKPHLRRSHVENVLVFECACWSSSATLTFRRTQDPAFSSAAPLLRGSKMEELPVVGRRLDDIWIDAGKPRVSLVKIDVEGTEAEVLSGAQKLIGVCRPLILVETADPRSLANLVPGYACEQPRGFKPWNWVLRPLG